MARISSLTNWMKTRDNQTGNLMKEMEKTLERMDSKTKIFQNQIESLEIRSKEIKYSCTIIFCLIVTVLYILFIR